MYYMIHERLCGISSIMPISARLKIARTSRNFEGSIEACICQAHQGVISGTLVLAARWGAEAWTLVCFLFDISISLVALRPAPLLRLYYSLSLDIPFSARAVLS